ncbi:MAG: hypothetical protein AVDCRST_MAG40-2226, partial [uncultured Gemmatimonadaceae bacterium]
ELRRPLPAAPRRELAQPIVRHGDARRRVRRPRAPGAALSHRGRRRVRGRADVAREGRGAARLRRARAALRHRQHQPRGVDGPGAPGAGAGAAPGALLALRGGRGGALRAERGGQPLGARRGHGRELRRLLRGHRLLPPPRLLRRAHRDERLLRPGPQLPARPQRRQRLLQQPGVVRAPPGRRGARDAPPPRADRDRHRPGRVGGAAPLARALRAAAPQGDPPPLRPVGPRRLARLALVAADAAVLPRLDVV